MLQHQLNNGRLFNFDAIGQSLAAQVKPGPRSPESRSNKYSFFSETDDVAMKTYSPAQIEIILKQREHLQQVLSAEVGTKAIGKSPSVYVPTSGPSSSSQAPPGLTSPNQRKSAWVPADMDECQFKCCQICRPTAEGRSYLSLDGIADGHIPPTAAAGFGFHHTGVRPVCNPDIVKNIGYRPVPLPRAFSNASDSPSSPPSSIRNMLNVIDEQLAEIKHAKEVARSIIEAATSQRITEEDKNETMQPCEEPSDVSHLQGDSCHDSRHTTENDTTKSQNAFGSACTVPLPAQTQQEEMMLSENLTQMEEEEIQEGRFHKTPLEVATGIAVLEESVEMHVPDVMTQF
ncbi:hypothetical protein E8E14_002664 [Neopestalotiopsis sp. 37M]|nr:hypothetical protein E8E14_002664 [Neopestalotiopsis sp. 37M]